MKILVVVRGSKVWEEKKKNNKMGCEIKTHVSFIYSFTPDSHHATPGMKQTISHRIPTQTKKELFSTQS